MRQSNSSQCRSVWTFTALGLSFLSSQLVSADTGEERLVAIVKSAIGDWSESVYSGSFRLHQISENRQVGLQGPPKQETDAYCVFDRANNRFRFDRTVGDESVAHIDGPDGSVTYSRQANVAAKYPAGKAPANYLMLESLDVRLIGIANCAELRAGTDIRERILALLSSDKIVEVLQIGQGDVQATWEYGEGNQVRRTVVFSASQNYRPTTMIEKVQSPGYGSRVEATSRVEWTEVGGSLVPLECTLEQQFNRLMLKLDWVSVNTPLDDKEFTVEGLDLPDGTLIANYTLGESKSFVEGRIGQSTESTSAIPRTRTWRRSVLWGNLVVLPLLLIAYLVVRRWRTIA